MNIVNKEEMLKESLSVIDEACKHLAKTGLQINEHIKSILSLCVSYGFEQGCIHGKFTGQLAMCDELQKVLSNKNENI